MLSSCGPKLILQKLQELVPPLVRSLAEEIIIDGDIKVHWKFRFQVSELVFCQGDIGSLLGRLDTLYPQMDVFLVEGRQLGLLAARLCCL